MPSPDGHGQLFVGTARNVTAERLAAQREATLAGFAAALAAAGEISEMLTTAARGIAAAVHASQVTTALWSSDDNPAITGWPRPAPGQGASAAVTAALDVVRHQPAASVAVLPGDEGTSLLSAPLDGTGSSAIAAEYPGGRPVGAEVRELFSVLTSHLAQVLAKARDYEQTRAVALTLQHAILAPTELPHGFAARYTPAVPPLQVGGDWYDVIALPGQRTGVVAGDCVGTGMLAAAVMGQLRSAAQAVLLRAPGPPRPSPTWTAFASPDPGRNTPPWPARSSISLPGRSPTAAPGIRRPFLSRPEKITACSTRPAPAAGHAARRLAAHPGDCHAAARRDLDAVHRRARRAAEPAAGQRD